MLACFAGRSGLEPREGCDLSARLYAVAAQVEALLIQADWVRRQAFPQTAGGESLDLHARMRGLARKEAARAAGVVRFTCEPGGSQKLIPKGTVCMTGGQIRFETTRDAAIPAGSNHGDVPVSAVLPGAAGNVAAGAIRLLAAAPVGVAGCSNPAPCTGGCDAEGDEELRLRVLDSFRRLPNGANAAYYQREALSFPQVAAAAVVPRSRGVGTVDVVVAGREGVPDEGLLSQLRDYFRARREIAVDVAVLAPETVSVDVTLWIRPEAGTAFQTAADRVRDRVAGWFSGQRLGCSVLQARLTMLAMDCEGVANCQVAAPAADVAITPTQLPRLGTLSVEELV